MIEPGITEAALRVLPNVRPGNMSGHAARMAAARQADAAPAEALCRHRLTPIFLLSAAKPCDSEDSRRDSTVKCYDAVKGGDVTPSQITTLNAGNKSVLTTTHSLAHAMRDMLAKAESKRVLRCSCARGRSRERLGEPTCCAHRGAHFKILHRKLAATLNRFDHTFYMTSPLR